MKIKNIRGITLISLIVTIIILLILAGITISSLTNNGLLKKAIEAKEITRIASIEEEIDVWLLCNETEQYNNSKGFQDIYDFTSNLVNKNLLTNKERDEILSTGKITLNGKDIIFQKYNYISNKDDLKKFRDDVNNGKTYKNEIVVLLQDINLDGSQNNKENWWTPIGSEKNKLYFEGTFDGNNHKIYNMYTEVDKGTEFVSFISATKNSIIKNLTVEGDIVLNRDILDIDDPAGSGIVGVSYGKCRIINCQNNVNVNKKTGGREVAGILGCAYVKSDVIIEKCVNTATIKGANATGGIVGTVYGKLIINDSYNQGDLGSFDTLYVGGIIARVSMITDVGAAERVEINNSYNSGSIKTNKRAGGILSFSSSGTLIINNSYNSGEIKMENSVATGYLGGIVGRAQQPIGKCQISNSYNTSNIYAVKQNNNIVTGGILGGNNSDDAIIINCYNVGNLNGDYTFGIVGLSSGTLEKNAYLRVVNSYNTGEIVGRKYAGGITRVHSYTSVDVKNAYYLKVSDLVGVQNAKKDESISLTVDYMKSESFAKDLNNNLSNIDIGLNLNSWTYLTDNYPSF